MADPKPDRNARRAAATDTAREMLDAASDSGAPQRVKSDLTPGSASPTPAPVSARPEGAVPPKPGKVEAPVAATPEAQAELEYDFNKAYEGLDERLRKDLDARFVQAQNEARDAGMKALTDRYTELYGWATPLLEATKDDKDLREGLKALVEDPEFRKSYMATASDAEIRALLKDKDMRDFLFRDAAGAYKPQLEALRAAQPKPAAPDARTTALERELAELKAANDKTKADADEARATQEYNDARAREIAALWNEGAEDMRYDPNAPNLEIQDGFILTKHLYDVA